MIDFPLWLAPAFFAIAMIYSMAGFAGGSSYLFVLTLAGISHTQAPQIALLCNIVVSSCVFWTFSRAGHFDFKKNLPFVLASVPAAYLGACFTLPKAFFYGLLGFSLIVAASCLLFSGREAKDVLEISARRLWAAGLAAGGVLGFLSGLLGIGGGIFLSPLLLLLRWADAKKAAAAASFFILVNSLSGLIGQIQKGSSVWNEALPVLVLMAFMGGQAGAYLSAKRLPQIAVQRATALIALYVSVNWIGKALF